VVGCGPGDAADWQFCRDRPGRTLHGAGLLAWFTQARG